MLCECSTKARTSGKLLTNHHPDCPKYDLESEVIDLIKSLVYGINCWAADEDGIHDVVWDAYCHALLFIGLPFPKERESTPCQI